VPQMERLEILPSVCVVVYGPSQDAMAELANDKAASSPGPRFEDQDPS
jgi:hypothetical protein